MFNRNGLRTQSLISVFSCSCLRTMLCIFCQLLVIFFLYYSGITTNQMCQSLHSSTRIIGNGKGLIHFSEFPDLFEHLTDTVFLHLYLFPVRKKTTQNKEKKEKKTFWEPCACCSRSHWVPYWLTVRQQKRTSRSHQQLPLAWINFTCVIQNVQALAECSSTE